MSVRLFLYEHLSGGGLAAGAEPALLHAGLAMREALRADLATLPDLEVCYASAGHDDGTPTHDDRATRPRPGESAIDFVRREAAAHDLAWIVAPETDGLLEALCRVVGPRRWVGCTREAIRLCASKRATLARLAALGLATPLACEDEATRWVVKPDDGAGSVATRVHASRRAAEADWAARPPPATLEPWVEGLPLSLSLLCREGRAELLSINRQRLEIDPDGRLDDAGVAVGQIALADPRASALHALAQTVARSVTGLRGFVGIDLVWHAARGPVAVEVNPRVTCAYAGQSALRGRSLAADILSPRLEALRGAR